MSKRIIFLVAILTLLTFTLTGCGLVDKLLSIKEDFKQEEQEQNQNEVGEIIVDTPDVNEPVINVQPTEYKTVLLYFGSADGEHLVSVEKDVPKVEGIARETVNALIEGPEFQSGLLPTIPAGTSLIDINVKDDGLCIVDFNKELVSNMLGGELNEQLTVYSVVNTLCQFPTIDKVEFRVEGQQMDTLLGYVNLEPTVSANSDIVVSQ
ncbi:MAG: GerMN domain-containing protein [Peptococcaceae bacterium]